MSLLAAYKRRLAEVDPNDRQGRRTIADTIAQSVTNIAMTGDVEAAREVRMTTEGEKQHHSGSVQVVIRYVNTWRAGSLERKDEADDADD